MVIYRLSVKRGAFLVPLFADSCWLYSDYTSHHLPVQSQQWRHQNNVWNLFKDNNKDRTTSMGHRASEFEHMVIAFACGVKFLPLLISRFKLYLDLYSILFLNQLIVISLYCISKWVSINYTKWGRESS